MSEKKLKIQPHRFAGESTVISVRLPKEMLSVIDRAAAETGRTRNEILVLSMEFALENMEIENRGVKSFEEARDVFQKLKDYKDSNEKYTECCDRIETINKEKTEEEYRIRTTRNRKAFILVASILLVGMLVVL